VFRAPRAYSVFTSCLVQATTYLQKALELIPEHDSFNIAKGHQWGFIEKAEAEAHDAMEAKDKEAQTTSTAAMVQHTYSKRTSQVLSKMWHKYPPPGTTMGHVGGTQQAEAAQIAAGGQDGDSTHNSSQDEPARKKAKYLMVMDVNRALGRHS